MVGECPGRQPVPPVTHGRGDVLFHLVLGGRGGIAPRQRNEGRFTFGQAGPAVAAGPRETEPEAADHRQRRLAVRRLDGEGAVAVTAVVPLTDGCAIVEQRYAIGDDLDVAGGAGRRTQEDTDSRRIRGCPPVPGAPGAVIHLADDHEIPHDEPARRGMPGRLDHHRAGYVAAVMRNDGVRRSEAERTGRAVEQRPEHTRRVGTGQAEPFHGSVGRDQTAVLAIRKEGILGDRRKRAHDRVLLLLARETNSVGQSVTDQPLVRQ